jgi:Protein of unknown function (DUF2950)
VKFSSDDSMKPESNSFCFGRAAVKAAILVFLLNAPSSFAQSGNEKTFASPGDAVLTLYKAVKSGDSTTTNAIFGSNAAQILHTGDDVADKNMAANFLRHYDQMHRVVIEPDQSATLYTGAENWPFPIPLVKNASGAWYFDTEAGKKEILYRRIGTNENDAIEVLHTLVDAQQEYASTTHDDDKVKRYAGKVFSDEGRHNGLYWKTSDNEPPSPVGPLLAGATGEGYTRKQGEPLPPFHGYYYRLLTKQGSAAKGGARDYSVNGQLTKGFAFVAYPADYRNSGVMTFIVNQDGIVYEKDLGADTATAAGAMSEYNPDKTWAPAD